jgi:hypothetical protein
MKGELLLRGAGTESDRVSEAVGCFSNAQTIARRQGSKALESRAAASLERVAGTSHTDAALTEKS